MTYDNFLGGLHAFLAVITTIIAILTFKNRTNIKKINIVLNGRMDELLKMVKAKIK